MTRKVRRTLKPKIPVTAWAVKDCSGSIYLDSIRRTRRDSMSAYCEIRGYDLELSVADDGVTCGRVWIEAQS